MKKIKLDMDGGEYEYHYENDETFVFYDDEVGRKITMFILKGRASEKKIMEFIPVYWDGYKNGHGKGTRKVQSDIKKALGL